MTTKRVNRGASKPKSLPLRRHHDDDYWDRIEITTAFGARLQAGIVPRYKTSGMSGDEWRISAHLGVFSGATPVFQRSFHRMNDLLRYSPHHIYSNCSTLLNASDATLVVQRKGVELMRQSFKTFGEAAIGMNWHLVLANEGSPDVTWHHLTDDEERARCQQVGCSEPPKNVFHLKKLQVHRGHSLLIEPEYDFTGQYTWYCARHTERGDCGLEDCDDNLELVKGAGVSEMRPEDESPASFGGVVELGKKS